MRVCDICGESVEQWETLSEEQVVRATSAGFVPCTLPMQGFTELFGVSLSKADHWRGTVSKYKGTGAQWGVCSRCQSELLRFLRFVSNVCVDQITGTSFAIKKIDTKYIERAREAHNKIDSLLGNGIAKTTNIDELRANQTPLFLEKNGENMINSKALDLIKMHNISENEVGAYLGAKDASQKREYTVNDRLELVLKIRAINGKRTLAAIYARIERKGGYSDDKLEQIRNNLEMNNLEMNGPQCSVCGEHLEYLGSPRSMFIPTASVNGADQPALEQWRGNVCLKCRYIFCPDCLDVRVPKCPVCQEPTKATMQEYLQGVSPRKLRVADKKTLEAEADTIEEAEAHVKAQIPHGFSILGPVEVLSDGKDMTAQAHGETADQAFADAEKQVPSGATIKDKYLIRQPERRAFTVKAFSEEDARNNARVNCTIPVKTIEEQVQPRMGFLGIGKKPGTYMINAVETALAQVTYGTKGKVRISIARFQHSRLP